MILPTYFICHGGGPWPFIHGAMRDMHAALEGSLIDMPRQLPQLPKVVLMVSAHWEAQEFTVMASARPGMLYDYENFHVEAYSVRYAAPGAPALASRVKQLAQASGLRCNLDARRGFDHGAFVPMSVIYPEAQVPMVQLSLKADYDPAAHLALGAALAPLREEGVLIVGSGSSFHNFGAGRRADLEASEQFDAWLSSALAQSTAIGRVSLLRDWARAPAARQAHAREDHLLPLMVAVGAARGDPATCIYHERAFMGRAVVSSYRFDAARA